MKAELSPLVSCLAEHQVHVCRPEDSLFGSPVLLDLDDP